MTNVTVSKSIEASAQDVWSKLAAFSGIEHFSPIAKSVVEGQGAGAKRTCTLPDGAEINEVLDRLDNENMELEYRILTGPFPITDYVSTINVKAIDANSAEVTWGCNFNVEQDAEEKMKGVFDGFYHTMIDSLEQLIQSEK